MANRYPGPADHLEHYERAIAHLEIERGGATMPYTSHNGHMFSFLDKTGSMALRLPNDALKSFLSEYDSERAVQHETTMKEYVVVPDDLLADTSALVPWVTKSYEWISTLEPKPEKANR